MIPYLHVSRPPSALRVGSGGPIPITTYASLSEFVGGVTSRTTVPTTHAEGDNTSTYNELPTHKVSRMDGLPTSLSGVEECDDLLASYEAIGLGQHDSLVIQLKRKRNVLLPIAHLPQELRCLIFDFVLPRQRVGRTNGSPAFSRFQVSTSAPFCYYLALFTLRQVSWSWNLEIRGTPSLWTVISTLFSNPFQELIWKQSQSMPLDVEVARKDFSSTYVLGALSVWTEEETAFLEQVMQRDIRELEMYFPLNEEPTLYLLDVKYPKLKALHILRNGEFEFASPLLAPQLADLRLFNCTPRWDSLIDLRSLSVGGHYRLGLAPLLQVLSASPLLERLELEQFSQVLSNDLLDESIPFDLLRMPRLSEVLLLSVSCEVVVGLLDRLDAPACRSAVIVTEIVDQVDLSALSQQAGRLCRSLGSSTQGHEPCLIFRSNSLTVEMGGKMRYTLVKNGWNVAELEMGSLQRAQLIRLFLKGCEGPRFKDPIPRACLRYDSAYSGFEGIKIIGEFWPKTNCLNVVADAGLAEMVQALSKNQDSGDESSKWCLPKLTELEFTTLKRTEAYDGLVDNAIERTEAASVSPSTISPITRLTLRNGTVRSESLTKLDGVDIQYQLYRVTVL